MAFVGETRMWHFCLPLGAYLHFTATNELQGSSYPLQIITGFPQHVYGEVHGGAGVQKMTLVLIYNPIPCLHDKLEVMSTAGTCHTPIYFNFMPPSRDY